MGKLFGRDLEANGQKTIRLYELEETENSYKFFNFNTRLKYMRGKYIFIPFLLMVLSEIVAIATANPIASTVWDILFALFIVQIIVVYYFRLQLRDLVKKVRIANKMGKTVKVTGVIYTPSYMVEVEK